MRPDKRFLNQLPSFWAHIRCLSQNLGYTVRGSGEVATFKTDDIKRGMKESNLSYEHLFDNEGDPNSFCKDLISYFKYRANLLNSYVRPNLMNKKKARRLFLDLKRELSPKCPLPMNKQKGEKKAEAYLTCIVNMLIEKHSKGFSVDYDPRQLTTVIKNGIPIRTLARRIDGAFPSSVNPIAVWEIKEYYNTTTFGSRVADGVYESLLDGFELEELGKEEDIKILHYLFVDDYYTWWECGKSYLCRLIDILHMGFVDEVIFGKEVINRLPKLVREWTCLLNLKDNKT